MAVVTRRADPCAPSHDAQGSAGYPSGFPIRRSLMVIAGWITSG
ncbi:hypothetical protein [Streptomyces venezuelae]|nr:hypothetical protein [Streptomyces venezuelae]